MAYNSPLHLFSCHLDTTLALLVLFSHLYPLHQLHHLVALARYCLCELVIRARVSDKDTFRTG